MNEFFAAIEVTPELVTTGILLITNLFTALKNRNYKHALHSVVEAVEYAAVNETNPKRAVTMRTAGTVAGAVVDSVLRKRGLYRQKTKGR